MGDASVQSTRRQESGNVRATSGSSGIIFEINIWKRIPPNNKKVAERGKNNPISETIPSFPAGIDPAA
jgi:hypothetical protein